jgi:hypothetical protein
MKNVNTKLIELLQGLYPAPLSNSEARKAARNLQEFMETLVEIDSQHKVLPEAMRKPPCA